MSEAALVVPTLAALATAEAACTRCPLYKSATQAVPGEGRVGARIMLVGEQPGDKEDLAGKPFVGPAGKILERALADAGIARRSTFITNAVKHFKFEARGKRRLHKRPNSYEIERVEHVRAYIKLAVELGGIIQATDPEKARRRDEELLSNPTMLKPLAPLLGPGLHGDAPAPAGSRAEQPRLEDGQRLDDRVGYRFAVLADPRGHVAIDSSGMLMDATGDKATAVGDTFVVHMDREALRSEADERA